MKVLCIKDCDPKEALEFTGPFIHVGEEKIVARTENGPRTGKPYYEFTDALKYFYPAERFAPLSDIDETEYVDEILDTMFVEKSKT